MKVLLNGEEARLGTLPPFQGPYYKWEDARELWMQLAVKKNPMQASCAQYNVALACYLMREYDLALEWLDLSDRNQVVDLSAQLRTRILEKKGK